ncbi:MAG: hypothetical protein QXT05_01240 [Candidatus Bilamarchaeaceae archaeon]
MRRMYYLSPIEGRKRGKCFISANGQSYNIKSIIEMLEKPEGQVTALSLLKNTQVVLAFLGAYHPSESVRGIALSLLKERYWLAAVVKFSPYHDSIDHACKKLGEMIEELDEKTCSLVACYSKETKDIEKALERAKKLISEGKIVIIPEYEANPFLTRITPLEEMKENKVICNLVTTPKDLIVHVIKFVGAREEKVKNRKNLYSSDMLEKILENEM